MTTQKRSHLLPQLLALVGTVSAAACAIAADTNERDALLALLEEETELATRTRLNADYVPGIVTILHGSELANRGARTVWDALAFVPGINPVIDQTGHRRLIIRGLGAIGDNYLSGNIKVLLNGVSTNSVERGFADSVYYLPIQQIDRIEVIRGPGSAIHGEYAIAGVVNVLTRREGHSVHAMTGEFGERGGAALLSTEASNGWQASLNIAAWESNGADVMTGPDLVYQVGDPRESNAPGRANEGIASKSAVAEIKGRGLRLLGQWTEHRIGDYFGVNYILPPNSDHEAEKTTIGSLEARYRSDFTAGSVELFTGTTRHRTIKDDLYGGPPSVFPFPLPGPVLVDSDYEEQKRYSGVELTGLFAAHQLLLGVYDARTEVEQAQQTTNFGFGSHPITTGTVRQVESAVLQDEYRATDRFSLTTGVRYDHYAGIDTSLTPRIAAVWRKDEQEVYKAQYGRSFRPPTFTEAIFGGPAIRPVVADTFELGYLRKGPRGEWRGTLFHSELKDLIIFDPANAPFLFRNANFARLRGVELEGGYLISERLKLDGNVAFFDSDLNGTGNPIPGSSDWLGRLGGTLELTPETMLAIDYRVIDGFHRQAADPRPVLDGYGTINTTVTVRPSTGLTLRAGIQNVTDEDVRYPAFLGEFNGQSYVSYPGDLPRPERTWWLSASFDF